MKWNCQAYRVDMSERGEAQIARRTHVAVALNRGIGRAPVVDIQAVALHVELVPCCLEETGQLVRETMHLLIRRRHAVPVFNGGFPGRITASVVPPVAGTTVDIVAESRGRYLLPVNIAREHIDWIKRQHPRLQIDGPVGGAAEIQPLVLGLSS